MNELFPTMPHILEPSRVEILEQAINPISGKKLHCVFVNPQSSIITLLMADGSKAEFQVTEHGLLGPYIVRGE